MKEGENLQDGTEISKSSYETSVIDMINNKIKREVKNAIKKKSGCCLKRRMDVVLKEEWMLS